MSSLGACSMSMFPFSSRLLLALTRHTLNWKQALQFVVEHQFSLRPQLIIIKAYHGYQDTTSCDRWDKYLLSGVQHQHSTRSCVKRHSKRWLPIHLDAIKTGRKNIILNTSICFPRRSNKQNSVSRQSKLTNWSLFYKYLTHHYAQQQSMVHLWVTSYTLWRSLHVITRSVNPSNVR